MSSEFSVKTKIQGVMKSTKNMPLTFGVDSPVTAT